MQVNFDTDILVASDDANALGSILSLMIALHGIRPIQGHVPAPKGWSEREIPADLRTALMGDQLDEGYACRYLVNHVSDLEVAWFCDGDITLMFRVREGFGGIPFAIVNGHGGRAGDWTFVQAAG